MVPMRDSNVVEASHEPAFRSADFSPLRHPSARAARKRTEVRAPDAFQVHGPNAFQNEKAASHEQVLGGPSSTRPKEKASGRTDFGLAELVPPTALVHGPNAFQKEKEASHEPGGTHFVAFLRSGPRRSALVSS